MSIDNGIVHFKNSMYELIVTSQPWYLYLPIQWNAHQETIRHGKAGASSWEHFLEHTLKLKKHAINMAHTWWCLNLREKIFSCILRLVQYLTLFYREMVPIKGNLSKYFQLNAMGSLNRKGR